MNQFKFFFNFFFLITAISQIWAELRVGLLVTFVAPLGFVISVTLIKEACDDIIRYKRDKEQNNEKVTKLNKKRIKNKNIKVGDILILNRNDRVPADCLLLWSSDPSGTTFIRTDQLDGETDWKLKKSCNYTLIEINKHNKLLSDISDIFIECEAPKRELYDFIGRLRKNDSN